MLKKNKTNKFLKFFFRFFLWQLCTTCKRKKTFGKVSARETERLVCVETDGQADMAKSTRLVMLIKNIYTLWSRNF